MVRVKHRYLVAQILYPEPISAPKSTASSSKPPLPIPSTSTSPGVDTSTSATLEFHRPTPANITAAHISRLVRDTIQELFGDAGAGLCAGSLAVKYFSPSTSTLILRCARDRARMVWAALMFMTQLPLVQDGRYRAGGKGVPCVFRVVRLSGTIRKSEEKIIEMARRDILRVKYAGVDVLDGIVGIGTEPGVEETQLDLLHGGIMDSEEDEDDLSDDGD